MPASQNSAMSRGSATTTAGERELQLKLLSSYCEYTKQFLAEPPSQFEPFQLSIGSLLGLEEFCKGNRTSGSRLHAQAVWCTLFEPDNFPKEALLQFAQSVQNSRTPIHEFLKHLPDGDRELGHKYYENVRFRGRMAFVLATEGLDACYQMLAQASSPELGYVESPREFDQALAGDVFACIIRGGYVWLSQGLAHNAAELFHEAGPYKPSLDTHRQLADDLQSFVSRLSMAARSEKFSSRQSTLAQEYLCELNDLVVELQTRVLNPLIETEDVETEDEARTKVESLRATFVDLRQRARRSLDQFELSLLQPKLPTAPDQPFSPSLRLVHQYLKCLAENDPIDFSKYGEVEFSECQTAMSEYVEGLFADLARRAEYRDQHEFVLTKGHEFRHEVCWELADRLCLSPLQMSTILRPLYSELVQFAQVQPRRRPWGRLLFQSEGMSLILDER